MKLSLKERLLPKSREEALANPIRVIAIHWRNFAKGEIDWIELNRPESLEFDLGIDIHNPTYCGELECVAD